MDAIEAILTRRSTRNYRPDAVEAEKLELVLNAAKQAPSGGNSQTNHFLVIQNSEVICKLAAMAQVNRARGAVSEVNSYIHETVQIAQMDGEVSNIYPKVGELVGTGSPIMTISVMSDLWGTFNVREDQLNGLAVGSTFTAFVPAFNKEIQMKVYYMKDQGSYAVWKATKANGQYDLKTFEVKARPVDKLDGLRPGMSLIIK